MHVQSCFFANLNLSLFCRSRCRRRRPCLSSLISLFWNFRGLNDLPEMRFEFPLNFIRKLIIKARTQILVHGGRGGGGAGQGFRCCFADGLNQKFDNIKGNNQESCSGFPQTWPTHCYGFVGCIIMIGHFLINHG